MADRREFVIGAASSVRKTYQPQSKANVGIGSPAEQINKQGLGRIVAAFKRDFALFAVMRAAESRLFMTRSDHHLKSKLLNRQSFRHSKRWGGPGGANDVQISVAGEGVVGPCGPRTGSSSGEGGGNSSGRAGASGSCTGAGTSGRGFPGGLSGGGSDGRPGSIGGSSVGSIGMFGAFCGTSSIDAEPIAPNR